MENEREKLLQDEISKHEKVKDLAKGKKAIKASGILIAYDDLLQDFIKQGMP